MSKSIRVVTYGSVMAAALAAAFPAQAELTRADRLGTPLIAEVPVASASAGSSAEVAPVVLIDRSIPEKTAVISEAPGSQVMNVDWGDTVLFTVREPGVPDRIVKWRFNGLDNVMSYADIDPRAQFASNVRIFVNQAKNMLRFNDGGD